VEIQAREAVQEAVVINGSLPMKLISLTIPFRMAGASGAIARLDQAFLTGRAFESVRQQVAVDGRLIDPWHLAAMLEGLRLRMDPYLLIIDRADILDKVRAALTLHQWIVRPDFDQEGEVQGPRLFSPGSGDPASFARGSNGLSGMD
jgi:hypothetical protein